MRLKLVGMVAVVLLVMASQALAQENGNDKPDAEAIARTRQQLQSFIASWASAWQSQFDDVYLLHYHSSFQPEGFKSLEEWETDRRNKVKLPEEISLSLDGFQLVELTTDTALVRFWLDYSRPGYADRTRKEMRLLLERGLWKIEREHNMEVQRQTADQDEQPAKETVELLQSVVLTWVSAWQSQLIDKYLAFYHPAFKPEGGQTLGAWKAQRRARLRGSKMTITIREFELVKLDANSAVVRFWLDYSRDGYADHTLKELTLRHENGGADGHDAEGWLIEREHNLQVSK